MSNRPGCRRTSPASAMSGRKSSRSRQLRSRRRALGCLGHGQSGEEPQLHQLGFAGVFAAPVSAGLRPARGCRHRPGAGRRVRCGLQINPLAIATALERLLAPGPFDQDPPHGLGRRREEMPGVVPLLLLRLARPAARRLRGPAPLPVASGLASRAPAWQPRGDGVRHRPGAGAALRRQRRPAPSVESVREQVSKTEARLFL